jgi:hypothetical protein
VALASGAVLGRAFADADGDGVQDGGEAGFSAVAASVYSAGADGQSGGGDDQLLGSTVTDANGDYLFAPLAPGRYYLQFTAPPGRVFSPPDQGGNDLADSDVNPATGNTPVFLIGVGALDSTRDVGLRLPGNAQVVGRRVFYNQSIFDALNPLPNASDDAAVDTTKSALLPGGTASFANYTGYSRGLNGIMIDIAGSHGTITAADFALKVGNNNSPGSWAAGPPPTSVTLRAGAGTGGADRYTLIWPNSAIQKTWLQITVLANFSTNLAASDVFYFGNALGDVGNTSANAIVTSADESLIRLNFTTGFGTVPVTSPYDIDKNRFVQTSDAALSRANQTTAFTALRLFVAPAASSPLASSHLAPREESSAAGVPASRDLSRSTATSAAPSIDFALVDRLVHSRRRQRR